MIETLIGRTGRYRGAKTLYDPNAGGAAVACPATLEVAPLAGGRFAGLRYTWSYPAGDAAQDGFILLGENDGGVFGTWIDSWHNGRNQMQLQADPEDASEAPLLRGSFAAPPGPDWGWTLAVHAGDRSMRIVMEVVTPEGRAAPAVDALFQRNDTADAAAA